MKKIRLALSALGLLWAGMIHAQTNLAGTWEGTLSVDPATNIDVQFILETAGDSYTAVLNAPDQPSLSNVPVTSLSVEGNTLRMTVDTVSGVYEGTVADGTINGTWTQQGAAFPLNLAPYAEPTLTDQDRERLLGSWVGELRPIPGGELVVNIVFRFERDEAGEFVALFDSPDEGAFGLALDSVAMDGDELNVTLTRARMEFTGTLSADAIQGEWAQGGRSFPLNLARGEFEVPGLELSAEAFIRLQGPWHGKIGPLNAVFRFEQNAAGKTLGFMDSPDQAAMNIPLTSVTVDGNQMTLTIAALGGSYTAELGTDQISGQWTQMGQTLPLTLERGLFVSNAGLSDELRQRLNGVWRGTVNNNNLIFR
ncbi:MAG: hypothetical protein WD772_12390, partial [Pseudohongiellaceae bacterium]